MSARLSVLAALALPLFAAGAAEARPEITVDLAVQYGRRTGDAPREGLFGLDLHAAFLADRESGGGFAAGATVHLGVFDFSEAHTGVGGALLVPVADAWPLVVEAWPLLAVDAGGARPGAAARLFFGSHPFPRLGAYVVTFGLFVEARWLPEVRGRPETVDLCAGVDVDAFALLWPWMLLWQALFG